MMRRVETLKVVMKCAPLFTKIDGYKYYIQFETKYGSIKEWLTNNIKVFDKLQENKYYEIEFEDTHRYVARRTAGIIVDMKRVNVVKEVD